MVKVELLDFGCKATIIKDNKIVVEILGVTIHNLYTSLFKVYGIDLYGKINLN